MAADGYKDELLDHNYDGIQEYDNPMPGWWSAIFVLTIIWAGIYLVGIELGVFPRYGDDLKASQDELFAMREAHKKSKPPVVVDAKMLLAAAGDNEQVMQGAAVYGSNCASCHGDKGQGGIGPNLTDDNWIYGPEHMSMHKTIVNGTSNGMPPWGSVLPPEEIVAVVAFIDSVHGTDPANAKEPQGDKFEWPYSGDAAPTEGGAEEAPAEEDGAQ